LEVYTLDPLLRRTELFEDHESLIWTERYKQYGDFEMHIASTRRARGLLLVDTLLAMDKSRRVMKIESVEDFTDDENRQMLTVKGRSIEVLMYDRVAKESLDDLTTSPKWTISGLTPTATARKIFHDICVTGVLSSYDIIPFINEGSLSAEPSNIIEPLRSLRRSGTSVSAFCVMATRHSSGSIFTWVRIAPQDRQSFRRLSSLLNSTTCRTRRNSSPPRTRRTSRTYIRRMGSPWYTPMA
jgi:hypothetical protein